MKKMLFIICLAFVFSCNKESKRIVVSETKHKSEVASLEKPRIEVNYSNYYKEAAYYCKVNNLNQEKFILIDLGLHSGYKRFFVYDFKKKEVSKSYLVSHGCGDNQWGGTYSKDNAKMSNELDSHCSSVGKYVVLDRGVSQWGIKVNYVLQGKEKSNFNAQKRAIVLHSWEEVSDDEVYPEGTPEGWGCPAVSNESMREIDELLKANKNILMWVIKS